MRNTEIAGNNGHYVSAPCTAQELITRIDNLLNLLQLSEDAQYIDTGDCLYVASNHLLDVIKACKQYLEWYNGSNQS